MRKKHTHSHSLGSLPPLCADDTNSSFTAGVKGGSQQTKNKRGMRRYCFSPSFLLTCCVFNSPASTESKNFYMGFFVLPVMCASSAFIFCPLTKPKTKQKNVN